MSLSEIYQNHTIECNNFKNNFKSVSRPMGLDHLFKSKLNEKSNTELYSGQENFEKIRDQKLNERNAVDEKIEQDRIKHVSRQESIRRDIEERKAQERRIREKEQQEKIVEDAEIDKFTVDSKHKDAHRLKGDLLDPDQDKVEEAFDSAEFTNSRSKEKIEKQDTDIENLEKTKILDQFHKLQHQTNEKHHPIEAKLEKIKDEKLKEEGVIENQLLGKLNIIKANIESADQKNIDLQHFNNNLLEKKPFLDQEVKEIINEENKKKQSLEIFLEKMIDSKNEKMDKLQEIIEVKNSVDKNHTQLLVENASSLSTGNKFAGDKIHNTKLQQALIDTNRKMTLRAVSEKSLRKTEQQERVRNADKAISALPNEYLLKTNHRKEFGIYDAKQNSMKSERNLATFSPNLTPLAEEKSNLTTAETEKLFNNKSLSTEDHFKDRTAHHSDLKKGFLSRIAFGNNPLPNSLNEYQVSDGKNMEKEIHGSKNDEDLSTSNSKPTSFSSNESNDSFNQSNGGDQSAQHLPINHQNENVVSLVENKIAPEILKQIERIRKIGKSWMRISMKDHQGNPLNLHLQVRGNTIQVRFGTNTEEIRGAIEASWGKISSKAKQMGVELKIPEFIKDLVTNNPTSVK